MNSKHMSDEIKVNRPAPAPTARPQAASAAESEGGSSKTPWIVLAVVVVVIVVLGILFREKLFGGSGSTPAAGEPSGYQAVFLTNGQVYFGEISNQGEHYVMLNDIFYLQVVQPPLQGTPQDPSQQQQQQQQQPQISLVKLGNELHGPIDEMNINRDHILFYEDLKEDSQVVQAIKQFKANPQGQAPVGQQAAPPPAQQQAAPPPAQQQQAPPPAEQGL